MDPLVSPMMDCVHRYFTPRTQTSLILTLCWTRLDKVIRGPQVARSEATRAQLANYLPPEELGSTLQRNPGPKYLNDTNIPDGPYHELQICRTFRLPPFESGISTDRPSISPPRHFRSNFLTPVQ
ncbi:hypothetical protein CEXT_707541 [Caerostris extrusa]|uniref:Uncharacterized protein n=1 Tax=Caerostris extrusa TaxID=172846 RepID=A0AAV4Y6L7_CAEEX|nr:hypothetical protein CEXT_707541 [Caerostris extrusa]